MRQKNQQPTIKTGVTKKQMYTEKFIKYFNTLFKRIVDGSCLFKRNNGNIFIFFVKMSENINFTKTVRTKKDNNNLKIFSL